MAATAFQDLIETSSSSGRSIPLAVDQVSKAFGNLLALDQVSFSIAQGEILGIVGPNGAGKTTLFDVIAGHTPPDRGRIVFQGRDVTRAAAEERNRRGIGRTFQIPRPFPRMSVADNLMTAALYGGALSRPEAREAVRLLMDSFGLASWAEHPAGALNAYGAKRLELARALATRPSLLLLDEPAAGLTEAETRAMIERIRNLADRGITVAWIEHRLSVIRAAHRLLVLGQGRVAAVGPPAEVLARLEVRELYMGR